MKVYHIALIIFGVGVVGGITNALLSGNTFLFPKTDPGPPKSVFVPGLLVTALIGGIAAVVSWGLYGVNAPDPITGKSTVTVAALAGAILIGFGGARWLTNEVDKTILNKTASLAAEKPKSDAAAKEILSASPIEALRIVREAK